MEKAILLFREQGNTGERFADTVARIGFENVQEQLLSDDLLARKEENIKAQKHLKGGGDLLIRSALEFIGTVIGDTSENIRIQSKADRIRRPDEEVLNSVPQNNKKNLTPRIQAKDRIFNGNLRYVRTVP